MGHLPPAGAMMTHLPFLAESSFFVNETALLRTAAFFVGAVLIVAGAKWVRDRLALRRGHRLGAAVSDQDNTPVAVETGGFVLAMVIGLLGSIVVYPGAWWEQALDLVGTGALVLLVMLFNDQIVTRFVLGGLDCNRAVVEDRNLAVAIVRASGNVGAAFAMRGALGHESEIWERLIWVVIGQVALVLLSRAYQWLTPYDDVAEVRHKNTAAALPMGGILVAVGVIVGAALQGEGAGWGEDLLSLGLDLAVSAVLVFVLRWAGDRLLLPGSTFHEEIARDKNAGAGFIEATTYVSGALAVAYFLN